jgi:hypothetical protein
MPKVGLMTQISRPFQVALAAFVLLAGVWLFALRGHSSSTGGSEAAVTTTTPATPSPIYHGSAPGVEGLSRAIAKAHGAVSTSQQNAKQLEERSAQASGGTSASTTATSAPRTTSTSAGATHSASPRAAAPATRARTSTPAPRVAPSGVPKMQSTVEAELKQGAIVTILFWSSKGADDRAVRSELRLLASVHRRLAPYAHNQAVQRLLKVFGLELSRKIAVHEASASQVSSFGTITRGVQVYGTPTILVINGKGQVSTLTGFTDTYAIEQAIDEARHA